MSRERVAKLLALAASPHDGEALAALRKALEVARGMGLTLTEAVSQGAASALDSRRIAMVEQEAYERGLRDGAEKAAKAAERPIQFPNPYQNYYAQAQFQQAQMYQNQFQQAQQAQAYQQTNYANVANHGLTGSVWNTFARDVIQGHSSRINDWERAFLDSWTIRHWSMKPSDKQQAVFNRIAQKLGINPPWL